MARLRFRLEVRVTEGGSSNERLMKVHGGLAEDWWWVRLSDNDVLEQEERHSEVIRGRVKLVSMQGVTYSRRSGGTPRGPDWLIAEAPALRRA